MKLPHFFLLSTFFITSSVFARKLNFIEAHNLRLSSQTHPLHWMNPFVFNKNPGKYETNIFASGQKDVVNLYNDIQSKSEQKIIDRLQDSFGKPYDISAKVSFGYKSGNFSQFISTNAGAVMLVTDPVFPDLKGFLFQDYTSNTSYIFRPFKGMMIKPVLTAGVRRTIDQTYTTGDLVSSNLDVRFNKAPYIGFAEINLLVTQNTFGYGNFLFELTSLPLMSYKYKYWDTFLGYKTPNFFNIMSFYGGYSPLYAGHYDVGRTYKTGIRVAPSSAFNMDVFTFDKFYPGALASYTWTHFELAAFTFERAYDDFGNQKSRQYGFNLKFAW